MSTYHMKAKMVSKHKQSAVAKASYTSNQALYSERDDELKKYKTRSVQPESFILAPKHAPDFVYNREKLWNEAEKIERSYNSQVMREIVISLPVELSEGDQSELTKKYVQDNFVDDGMVADVSIHRDQEHNPHAHILLTVRPFNQDGSWWKTKAKKEYMRDSNGEKIKLASGSYKSRKIDLTGWNDKDNLLKWRENLATLTNEFYKKNGLDIEVSHKSFKDQGIEKEATQRLTREEYYIEKKAKEEAIKDNKEYVPVTYYGKINFEIENYNKEIAELTKQIESMETERKVIQPDNLQMLDDVRKNIHLTDLQIEATQLIKKRNKVDYVDYDIAKKNVNSMDYWKRSIEKKSRALNREQKLLENARSHFVKGSSGISKYGFSKEQFAEQYNAKIITLDKGYDRLRSEFDQFKDMNEKSIVALDLQKEFIKDEFIYLYPKYKDIADLRSNELSDIMNKYVTDYKENNNVHESIYEFEKSINYKDKETLIFRDSIIDDIKDYRILSKQHFTLDKKMKSLESDYREIMKEHGSDLSKEDSHKALYDISVKYLVTKKESDHHEKTYQTVKNNMFNSLIELYGEEQKEVIEKLPDRFKVKLLEEYIENREVGNLKDDLIELKYKNNNKQFDDNWNKDFENNTQSGSSASATAGNILSELIEQAQKNEGDYDANKNKHRHKKGKLTKEELLDNEL